MAPERLREEGSDVTEHGEWTEWVGAIHMHSKHSDGIGSVAHIRRVAHHLGLDYAILTDHDSLAGLPASGYADDTLFLVGAEITCADNSHCLALGLKRLIPKGLSPQQVIDEIRRAGALSILAHPYDRGSPLFRTHYPWRDWSVSGFDALEMWNFLVDWAEGMTNWRQALRAYRSPGHTLDGPNPDGLRHWDEVNRRRYRMKRAPLPVIGGVDAHGHFLYRRSLSTVRTYLWAPPKTYDAQTDEQNLLRAIRLGRSFLANDAIAPAHGFRFTVKGRGPGYPESQMVSGPVELAVEVPRQGEIRLIRNGTIILKKTTTTLIWSGQVGGTYRVEVFATDRNQPWIFSNAVHVYVK